MFRRELSMVVLGSGSKGNATWIGDGTTGVLVDCGLSTRQIFKRMEAVGLQHAPIDAVLVSHEHSDHIGGARVLCNRLRRLQGKSVPFYMTAGTLRGAHPKSRPDAVEEIVPGEMFRVRHFLIDPFSIPHDVRDPVAFRVGVDGVWVGVVTDLGKPTALVERKLTSLSLAVIEFNHDTERLLDGPYPWHLKQRIRSAHGHLSNDQAGSLLTRALEQGCPLRHVVLGHLSDENNTPELARLRCEAALAEAGRDGLISVDVAGQAEPVRPLSVATHPSAGR
jgi:phosphoribosyl 1,2-cyclic phosphodiesterase